MHGFQVLVEYLVTHIEILHFLVLGPLLKTIHLKCRVHCTESFDHALVYDLLKLLSLRCVTHLFALQEVVPMIERLQFQVKDVGLQFLNDFSNFLVFKLLHVKVDELLPVSKKVSDCIDLMGLDVVLEHLLNSVLTELDALRLVLVFLTGIGPSSTRSHLLLVLGPADFLVLFIFDTSLHQSRLYFTAFFVLIVFIDLHRGDH